MERFPYHRQFHVHAAKKNPSARMLAPLAGVDGGKPRGRGDGSVKIE